MVIHWAKPTVPFDPRCDEGAAGATTTDRREVDCERCLALEEPPPMCAACGHPLDLSR